MIRADSAKEKAKKVVAEWNGKAPAELLIDILLAIIHPDEDFSGELQEAEYLWQRDIYPKKAI